MMKHTKLGNRQKGMSTVGIITIVGIFGFLVVGLVTVFPMYYDNFKLQSSLEALQNDSSVDPKSKQAIWGSLKKRLYINEVRSITKNHVKMIRKDGKTTVTVSYEARDTFVGNMFIGATFEEIIVIDR
jgi:flagellar basal body-associated protein FliL